MNARLPVPSILALVVLPLVTVTPACAGGDGDEPVPDEIVIEASEIEALDNYAFTSVVEMSMPEGDLRARLEGGFQSPDRFQATLTVSGEGRAAFPALLERPAEVEMAIVPPQDQQVWLHMYDVWWRDSQEEWQFIPFFGSDGSEDPFSLLAGLATPRFYLQSVPFSSLRLPVQGPGRIRDVDAYHVRLDRQAIMDLRKQVSYFTESGEPVWPPDERATSYVPTIVGNAESLPEDFVVDAWLAADGHYPARIRITFTPEEEGMDFLGADHIRLQIDITDPDADFEIEVPEVDSD